MKSVYEASNSIEAHLILDQLEQAGLKSRVDGEYLQGGMGELQAIGIVRVMVNESDYDQAKSIIEKWDAQQPTREEPKAITKRTHFTTGAISFIFGVVIVTLFYNTPVTDDGIDYNGDGSLDEKWTYLGGRITKTEIDRNFDGRVDLIYEFDRKGLTESSRSDEDFNGSFETTAYFDNGNMMWSRSDTNGDGFADYRMAFEHGVLSTIAFVSPETQKPVKVQRFKGIKLDTAEVDTTGDGFLDTIYEYDNIEEISIKTRQEPSGL